MIIKGSATSGAGRVAAHLLRADQNERVGIVETRGTMSGNLRDALREMETAALCSRTKRPLYHASINPRIGERMDEAQWSQAVDRLEEALGLTGQPRAVIEHVKDGRAHRHIVWSRIDIARGTVISDSHNFRKHEKVARELERAFGFALVQGAHVGRKGRERPARTPSHAEMQQAARTGVSPQDARAQITALWRSTTTGREFADALRKAGWTLCRGDRRDFALLDPVGGVHSLARRIDGARAKDIRARLADIDPSSLPSVKQARAALRATESPRRATMHRFPRRSRQAKAEHVAHPAQPRVQDRRGQGGEEKSGFYVTVSRRRLDYSRPLVQSGANANPSPRWTAARIAGLGEFRAGAWLIAAPVKSPRSEAFEQPTRPATANEPFAVRGDDDAGAGGDEGLSAFLAAVAAEVQSRAADACAALATEFGARMANVRMTAPKDQVAGLVAVLKNAMRAAIKSVQESAGQEIHGRQKAARVLWRRRRLRSVQGDYSPWGWGPKR